MSLLPVAAQPQPVTVAPPPDGQLTRVRELTFNRVDLTNAAGGTSTATLTLPDINATGNCDVTATQKVALIVRLDMGEVYNLGAAAGTSQVQVTVQGFAGGSAVALPAPLANTFTLQVDATHPAQSLIADLTAFPNLTSLQLTASRQQNTPPSFRLVARVEQTLAINPPSAAIGLNSGSALRTGFEQTFSWQSNCPFTRSYQVQILRLTPNVTVTDRLWDTQAVLLEKDLSPVEQLALQNGNNTLTLTTTVAEGAADYRWRVRAIGSLPGGIATPANWGNWSASAAFTLDRAGITNLNWIYNRTFSEGGRATEQLSFANGLLQTRQVQTRLASTKQTLALQTLQDYVGRDAFRSLPIPLSNGTGAAYTPLGFQPGLLTVSGGTAAYSKSDFDSNTSYRTPALASEPLKYYAGPYSVTATQPNNDGVASAEGVPFVRTLFTRDGSNRVQEESEAGPTLGLHTVGAETHTVRTSYASVAQSELDHIFGPTEAPQAVNTYKIITQDANNVATVNYQTKSGQTIATALSGTSGTTALAALPSANSGIDVEDQLTNQTNYNDLGSISTKLLTLPVGTTLHYTYKITPQTLTDDLGCAATFCSTCDYHIEVRLKSVDNPEMTPVCLGIYDIPFADATCAAGEMTPAPIACPTGTSAVSTPGTYAITVAGTYALEKIVTSYNHATGVTSTYLDTKLADLQSTYEAIKTNALWNASNGISSFLDPTCPHVANLYQFLDSQSQSDVERVPATGPVTSYKVRFGCDGNKVEIPVLDLTCGQNTACHSGQEFLDFLQTQVPTFTDANVATYFPGLTSLGDLKNMMDQMMGDPTYNCTSMWNCWQGTVAAYVASVDAANTTPPGGIPSGVTNTEPPKLLRGFLSCLDAPILYYGSVNISNAYNTAAFDPGNGDHLTCFNGLFGPSGMFPDKYRLGGNNFIPALSNSDYEQLMACIEGKQSADTNGPPTLADVEATIANMETACQKRCDDRRQEFEQAILRDFRRQGIYTYLDHWVLIPQPGDDNVINDLQHQIADIKQQQQDLLNQLSASQLDIWTQIQGLYTQLGVLQGQVPQTCLIENQIVALQGQISALAQQLPGSAADKLHDIDSQLANIQGQLVGLQPTTYIAGLEPFGPKDEDPNGNPVIQACEIAMMVQELVDECRGYCDLRIDLNADGTAANNPAISQDDLIRFQNAITGEMEVTVRPVKEGCDKDYKETPVNPSLTFHNVELTQCAIDVISYMDALARKFTSFAGFPNHSFRATDPNTVLLPCPGINSAGLGEYRVNNLSYVAPLQVGCNRMFNDYCSSEFKDREHYWVAVQDGRSDIADEYNYFKNEYFQFHNDFRILWLGYDDHTMPPQGNYEVQPGSPYRTRLCLPSGEASPGIPKLVNFSCPTTGTEKQDYLVRFVDINTKKEIDKDNIASISRPFLDVSGGVLGGYADPFSTDNIFVNITLTNHKGQVKARVVVSKSYQDVSQFLMWKSVSECEIKERHYATCYRWTQPAMPPHQGGYEPIPPTCEEVIAEQLRNTIAQQQDTWIQNTTTRYRQLYAAQCAAPESLHDNFSFTYRLGYHHFTLYYYDRADNLMRTLPPKAVNMTDPTLHKQELATTYQYNSLKQLVQETSPDGGVKDMLYNRAGQLRFSVNDRQLAGAPSTWTYSYTRYDALGRIIDVGESGYWGPGTLATRADALAQLQGWLDEPNFPYYALVSHTETVYNQSYANLTYLNTGSAADAQQYLTNRVSYTRRYNANNQVVLTYYSYDPHGNVKWLAEDVPGLARKYTSYDYDLLSNKVLRVSYQAGYLDQFYHRYEYDDDNRLTAVYTSSDGQLWDRDARYEYYAHGPLKRLELGQDKVQGIDYTYTLQGWLKAINHSNLDPAKDPGGDGLTSGAAADAFGLTLGYFDGDYVRAQSPFTASVSGTPNADLFEPGTGSLYDGTAATWQLRNRRDIASSPGATADPRVSERYKYDQVNRLVRTTQLAPGTENERPDFTTTYAYDPNGNLTGLRRRLGGTGGTDYVDRLRYNYVSSGKNNRLLSVNDSVSTTGLSSEDIDDQAANNYTYDATGNVTSDAQGNVAMDWTGDGKMASVRQYTPGHLNEATYLQSLTTYLYDAAGRRVRKSVSTSNGYYVNNTFYLRDAQGNILAVYERADEDDTPGPTQLVEQTLYGTDRLGVRKTSITVAGSTSAIPPGYTYTRTLGEKNYELTDPLGNVRAVVTDRKLLNAQQAFVPALSDYYNYYAFGMLQPNNYGRNNSATQGGYRYGHNGQDHDETLGLNHYTAEFWEYDSRLGRRWNLDPKPITEESEYAVFRNNPVRNNDPNGDCPMCVTAAVGGLVGGLLGGAVDAGMQIYKHGEVKDWASVGKSAAQGAFTGAVAGLTGGASLTTQIVAGGAANAIAGAARNKVEGKPITAKSIAIDVAVGAGGVAVGALAGKAVKALQSRIKCTCFAAGTAIQTKAGGKPIEQIQVGDSVWAYNEVTRQTALRPVTHLIRLQRDTTYILQTVQGDVIHTTSNHPFYVKGRWVQAQRLHVGDSLVTQRGQRLLLTNVQIKVGKIQVYNFTVSGLHTYFVSTSAILVHNACPLINYQGGAYGKLKNVAGQTERHHLVADAISPVSKYKGPAIMMDKADHALTMSYKNSATAQRYRAIQDKLASQGQFERAFEMDVKFIQKAVGTKYDNAIQQARQYYQQSLKTLHP